VTFDIDKRATKVPKKEQNGKHIQKGRKESLTHLLPSQE
jgi:hypothetical protein